MGTPVDRGGSLTIADENVGVVSSIRREVADLGDRAAEKIPATMVVVFGVSRRVVVRVLLMARLFYLIASKVGGLSPPRLKIADLSRRPVTVS